MTTTDISASVRASAAPRLAGRLEPLQARPEEGAQAVEYTMITGLGAGLLVLLWQAIERFGLVDKLVKAVVKALLELVTGWF